MSKNYLRHLVKQLHIFTKKLLKIFKTNLSYL